MPPVLPEQSSNGCCGSNVPCEPTQEGPPGIQGPAGSAGSMGTNGQNSYTLTTHLFNQPTVGANVIVNVANGLWASVGQHVFVSVGGDYIVVSTSALQMTLQNTGATGNAAPATVIASSNTVSASGVQGPSGSLTGTAGGRLAGTYPNPNLAATGVAAGTYPKVTVSLDGTVSAGSGLVSGDIPTIDISTGTTSTLPVDRGGTGQITSILGFNALSPLTTKGDTLLHTGASNVRQGVGANGQNLVARSSLANGIGYQNGYIQLGLATCNANTTGDTAIPILAAKYIVRKIIAHDASISLTTVAGGVYTAAAKGGSALVAAVQVYSALTAASKYLDLTLQAPATTDSQASANLYFSPTTPQGAAATVVVEVWGEVL